MQLCMDRSPDWNLYRSFVAVMDAGSLSGAARSLGLAQPTVGRHIEALEVALGAAPLFTRSAGGLRPTRAAEALAPHARSMASAAETLLRAASGEPADMSGVVRVTASDIVALEVLPAILSDFRRAWPRIDIELSPSNTQQDLLRRDADVAVRMARPTQNALFARRIGAVTLSFYAHRAYLERHGEPRTMAELTAHTLIGYDRMTPSLAVLNRIGLPADPAAFGLRSDSDPAQLACLRAGYGVGVCQRTIARRDPDLIPILTDVFGFDLELWVVMHEDLKADRRMRALFDHVAEGLKAYLAADA